MKGKFWGLDGHIATAESFTIILKKSFDFSSNFHVSLLVLMAPSHIPASTPADVSINCASDIPNDVSGSTDFSKQSYSMGSRKGIENEKQINTFCTFYISLIQNTQREMLEEP